MRDYLKMTMFVFASLILLASLADAYSYSNYRNMDVSQSVSYDEDIEGGNRGFTLKHTSSVPRTNPIIGCDYYDWTSDFRKCRRTAYYNGYSEDYYGYVYGNNNDYRSPYNQDAALKDAFKTFQQSSKQQFQLESKRIDSVNRRYYGYGGYGYGYGYYGAGYYRYGW